jgi:hypothetical protein
MKSGVDIFQTRFLLFSVPPLALLFYCRYKSFVSKLIIIQTGIVRCIEPQIRFCVS